MKAPDQIATAGSLAAGLLFLLAFAAPSGECAPTNQTQTDPRAITSDQPVQATVYDLDPNHLWNRLFAIFYCRRDMTYPGELAKTTKAELLPAQMGAHVLDPPLGIHPRFLLDEKPFTECESVLDEFIAARGERLIRDPLKRAVMQRDLWAVFDLVQTETEDFKRNYGDTPKQFTATHQEHRRAFGQKLAAIIRRLALSRKEIEALPNTYTDAIRSGTFPDRAVGQSKGNYLPGDLFARDSRWVEVSPSGGFLHMQLVRGRSVFRVFLGSPESEKAAKEFSNWIEAVRQGIEARQRDPEGFDHRADRYEMWERTIDNMPTGTQFLLLREMVCLDEKCELVPTRVVESIQLRVYLTRTPNEGDLTQLFEEFEMDRPLLFGSKSGGFRPIGIDEPRVFGYMALGRLAVNETGQILPLSPFPQNCITCHVQRSGIPMVQSLSRGCGISRPDPARGIEKTIRWKREQKDFKRLLEWAGGEKVHEPSH
jgi:hypothetical protein